MLVVVVVLFRVRRAQAMPMTTWAVTRVEEEQEEKWR
jgi:hypothetical protein